MGKKIELLIEKAAQALRAAGAREVYIIGSAAKGILREDSDIDFAVSGLPPEKFFRAMGEVGDIVRRNIDLVDLAEINSFTQYLQEEGELQRVTKAQETGGR
jgi:predicted nucleotidyltransferase